MNAPTQPEGVAVVCDRHGDNAAAMQAYLQAQGVSDPEWYAPRDVDEVDKALRAGRVRRIIFPRMDDFLDVLWEHSLALECWQAADTRIEFVEPSGPITGRMPMPPDQAHLAAVLASWERWRRRRRRRQAVAGLILSAVAVAAAFTVFILARGGTGL